MAKPSVTEIKYSISRFDSDFVKLQKSANLFITFPSTYLENLRKRLFYNWLTIDVHVEKNQE